MRAYLYRLRCLTNLHVGSGEANFNIVDKEVETDPVTGLPIIHASGFKGALRDDCITRGLDSAMVNEAFGAPGGADDGASGGALRFLDAHLLCRPMRTTGATPSLPVTSLPILREYLSLINAFSCNPYSGGLESISYNSDAKFLCTENGVRVEGDATAYFTPDQADGELIRAILGLESGGHFALAKSFDGYDLPVIARNNVQPDHRNLWYEEFVPHGSRFSLIILALEGKEHLMDAVLPDGHILQVGGNASVGYGFCKAEKCGEGSV